MTSEYVRLVEREETPLWVALVIEGCAGEAVFQLTARVAFHLSRYRFIGRVHEIGAADLDELAAALSSRIAEEGLSYFEWYEDTCRRYNSILFKTAQDQMALPKATTLQELSNRLACYFTAARDCMPYMLSILPVQDILAAQLGDAVKPLLSGSRLSQNTALALMSQSASPTALEEESRCTAALAREARSDPRLLAAFDADNPVVLLSQEHTQFFQKLVQHCDRYGWLRTFTYRNRPFGAPDLIARIRDRNWRETSIRAARTAAQAEDESMRQVAELQGNLDSQGTCLLELARRYAALRFDRIDVHSRSAACISPLLEQAAAAVGLSYDLLAYLTDREILEALREGSAATRSIAEGRRTNGFDVTLMPSGKATVSSPTMLRPSSAPRKPTLQGSSACLGEWTGRVRIVRSASDCASFERGDVLVCPMTTPEFMVAIERAGAIVTDEGGLLCHAAIISRELGIPCVVGTELASHVLRSGESVSVCARPDKGVVLRNEF